MLTEVTWMPFCKLCTIIIILLPKTQLCLTVCQGEGKMTESIHSIQHTYSAAYLLCVRHCICAGTR